MIQHLHELLALLQKLPPPHDLTETVVLAIVTNDEELRTWAMKRLRESVPPGSARLGSGQ
jgi:hypothetical protein